MEDQSKEGEDKLKHLEDKNLAITIAGDNGDNDPVAEIVILD